MVSFRTFRCPLFRKSLKTPISWFGLFLRQNDSTYVNLSVTKYCSIHQERHFFVFLNWDLPVLYTSSPCIIWISQAHSKNTVTVSFLRNMAHLILKVMNENKMIKGIPHFQLLYSTNKRLFEHFFDWTLRWGFNTKVELWRDPCKSNMG